MAAGEYNSPGYTGTTAYRLGAGTVGRLRDLSPGTTDTTITDNSSGGWDIEQELSYIHRDLQHHTFKGMLEIEEMTNPANAPANRVRVYARDNGGKTELVALFPSGAVQPLGIEPD